MIEKNRADLVRNNLNVWAFLLCLISLALPLSATAQTCADLDGAYVLANDGSGRYLGFFGNQFSSDSIMNSFGSYGSSWGVNSVRNSYGTYGSSFSSASANNPYAANPPIIYKYGVALYYLTTNSFKTPSVSLSQIDSSCTFFSTSAAGSLSLPSAPISVSAADGASETALDVIWSAATGATSYNVYVSQENANYTFLGSTANTSTSITGLSSGVTYYVAVTGVNSVGESIVYTYDTGFLATPSVSYTVTPTAGANGTITPAVSQSVADGATLQLSLKPNDGYQVASVGGSCGGSLAGLVYTTSPVTASCTVEAAFEEVPAVSYTVSPSAGLNGSISPSNAQTILENTSTQFTLSADTGYRLASVGGTCGGTLNGNVFTTDLITANCTVSASFEAIPLTQYTVSASAQAGGDITPQGDQTVADGSVLQFTLTPSTGFEIGSVGGTCGGALSFNTYTTNPITASCSVVASFDALPDPVYEVTPTAGANGTISPSVPQNVTSGLSTTFTVTPDTGFKIASVGGTCGGTLSGNTYTTNAITAACTVDASFTEVTYAVTPTAGDNGAIDPAVPTDVAEGASTTFTVTPDTGFKIASVGGTCGGTLSGNTYTTNAITAACTVDASFTEVTYAVTPTAGDNGAIDPAVPTDVAEGASTTFTVTPDTGFKIASVGGTCGGTLSGNTYTTSAITAACTVDASFTREDEVIDLGEGKTLELSFASPLGCTLIQDSARAITTTTPPPEIETSIGSSVEFSLEGCGASESVRVTVDFGESLPAGAKAYKIMGDDWIEITSATISETSISYEISDNGPYDSNDTLGLIDDPVTAAVPVNLAMPPKPVPVLPFWLLISLSGLVGLFGYRKLA